MQDRDITGICRNCGTELKGEFCHDCGQSANVIRRPAKELIEDAFSYVFQWDNRLIHTLVNLFFKPGKLSLDWVDGKRMRYVPPFRLYIIASFILFLLVGISTQRGVIEFSGEQASNEEMSEELQKATDEAHERGEWFSAALLGAVSEAIEDPSEYSQKIISNLPKAAFIFLPLFALLHMAAEFRKDRFYIDYLVFSIHFHAFAFSLLALIVVAGMLYRPAGEFAQLLNFLVPVYAIIGIRRFNSQGWIKSCLKGMLIFGAYSVFLGIGVACFFAFLLFV